MTRRRKVTAVLPLLYETKTVDHLKGAINAKKANRFYDVDADELAL